MQNDLTEDEVKMMERISRSLSDLQTVYNRKLREQNGNNFGYKIKLETGGLKSEIVIRRPYSEILMQLLTVDVSSGLMAKETLVRLIIEFGLSELARANTIYSEAGMAFNGMLSTLDPDMQTEILRNKVPAIRSVLDEIRQREDAEVDGHLGGYDDDPGDPAPLS